jgi:hypothetical protein
MTQGTHSNGNRCGINRATFNETLTIVNNLSLHLTQLDLTLMIILTNPSGPRYLADQRRELEGWTSHPEGRTQIPAGIRVLLDTVMTITEHL